MTNRGERIAQPRLAGRMRDIAPFYVMELLARARRLEAAGRDLVHMEIGEPDFATPAPIVEAGHQALTGGHTHYTPAFGLQSLRDAVSEFYRRRYGVEIDARRIAITPGASGALLLALGVLVNPGDAVMMADPGYPCNRHFVRMFEGRPLNVPVDSSSRYQLTHEICLQHWRDDIAAILLSSPGNPTGTLVGEDELSKITSLAGGRGCALLVDEIYHGLVYTGAAQTALQFSADTFVINSFSKYFGMTGWRLGWLVVPEAYIDAVDRLAQNVFLAASTPAQHAALAAFNDDTLAILEQRRQAFAERRAFLLPALRELGFSINVEPDGAFYIYADASSFTDDSMAFANDVLDKAGVVITPGHDFGSHKANTHIRFAYTTSVERLEEGVSRLRKYLALRP